MLRRPPFPIIGYCCSWMIYRGIGKIHKHEHMRIVQGEIGWNALWLLIGTGSCGFLGLPNRHRLTLPQRTCIHVVDPQLLKRQIRGARYDERRISSKNFILKISANEREGPEISTLCLEGEKPPPKILQIWSQTFPLGSDERPNVRKYSVAF